MYHKSCDPVVPCHAYLHALPYPAILVNGCVVCIYIYTTPNRKLMGSASHGTVLHYRSSYGVLDGLAS